MNAIDRTFEAWLTHFRSVCGRQPVQTERMAAYGYLVRKHDAEREGRVTEPTLTDLFDEYRRMVPREFDVERVGDRRDDGSREVSTLKS